MSTLVLNKPFDLLDPPSFKVTRQVTSGPTEVYTLSGPHSEYDFTVIRGQLISLGLTQNSETVLTLNRADVPVSKGIYNDAKAGRLLDWLPKALDGHDKITGSSGNDGLGGYAGNDQIDGRGGNDRILGGDGHDFLVGGLGNDTLVGGKGDDDLYIGTGADRVDGGWGVDWVYVSGTAGVTVDLLRTDMQRVGKASAQLTSIENVWGTEGGDRLFGTEGANRMVGDEGNDVINGRGGNDVLIGRDGRDTMVGGTGRDEFLFFSGEGTDTIKDFVPGTDKIEFFKNHREYGDPTIRDSGRDTRIVSGDNVIILENVDHRLISSDDIIFSY